MSLTPELVTAISGLIVAVIASIGTLYVAIQNGRKTTAAAKVASDAAEVAKATATENKAQIAEVHILVDGAQTELKKEIARLSEIIAGLTGTKGDVKNAEVTADIAKDSAQLSKDLIDKLPNG